MSIGSPRKHNTQRQTLTGDDVLLYEDGDTQYIDPGGASRTITLPAPRQGAFVKITNTADAAESIVVNDNDDVLIQTILQGKAVAFGSSSTAWFEEGATSGGTGAANSEISASDYSALTETILEDGTSLTDAGGNSRVIWTAVKANSGPSVSSGVITANMRHASSREGALFQGEIPSDVYDLSTHNVMKVTINGGGLAKGLWEFRTASGLKGTDIATEADVLNRYPLSSMPLSEDITFYFYLSGTTSRVQYFGVILLESSINANQTNTIDVTFDNVTMPAMPKWWNAVVSNPGKDILIPADYTDAVADPPYTMIPAGTTVTDLRATRTPRPITVEHRDGTQNVWLMDDSGQTDVTAGLMRLHCDAQDGDHYVFPDSAIYLNGLSITDGTAGEEEAIGFRNVLDVFAEYNNSIIYSNQAGRNTIIYTADRDAGHLTIDDLRVMGYAEKSYFPGDGVSMTDIGMTLTGSGDAVLTAQGDQFRTAYRDHGRMVQADGRLQMEAKFTWSASSAIADDVEAYWGVEPTSDWQSTSVVHDGDLTDATVYEWTESVAKAGEWWCHGAAGTTTNPKINGISGAVAGEKPDQIFETEGEMSEGTVGSLSAGEWDWGANDGQSFDTVYVKKTSGTDPGVSADITYSGETFQDLSTESFAALFNNDDWIRNKTTGMEVAVRAIAAQKMEIDIAGGIDGASGGAVDYFSPSDVIDVYERCPDIEIYDGSGNLVVDANGHPTTKLTPPTEVETWTIRASLARHHGWFTPIHFRKLTGTANTITFTDITEKNMVLQSHAGHTTIQSSGISLKNCHDVRIRRYRVEGVSGDGIACQGNLNYNNVATDGWIFAVRRQCISTTESNNFRVENTVAFTPGRSIIDVEPSSGPAIRMTVKNLIAGGIDKGNGLGQWFSAGSERKQSGLHFEGLRLSLSPNKSTVGSTDTGASPSGNRKMIGGFYDNIILEDRPNQDIEFDGSSQIMRGMVTRSIQYQSGATDNYIENYIVLPDDRLVHAGDEYVDFYQDDGTSNVANGLVFTGDGDVPWTGGSGQAIYQPVNVGTATTPEIYNFIPGRLRKWYGSHYRGMWPGTDIHHIGGLDMKDEAIYNIHGLRGSSTRRDGRNFTNIRGRSAGNSFELSGNTAHVVFPLIPGEIPTAPGQVNIADINAISGGSLADATQYFYMGAVGTNRTGMFPSASNLTTGGTYGTNGTTASPNLSFNFGLRAFLQQSTGDISTKLYLFRGTTDGIYTHRYDVEPSKDIKGDFAMIQDQNVDHVDTGTTLTHDYGNVNNGYAATYSATTGNIVTGSTLTADDADPGTVTAVSTTMATDSTKDFVELGVEPGHRFTNTTRSLSATIQEIYPGRVLLDAAIAGQVATDAYTIDYEWGQGGYQVAGGIMTYAVDQFNDESLWEPDANYHVELDVEVPWGVTFDYARYDIHRARWGFVVKFRAENGTLVSPVGGSVWLNFKVTS